MANDIDMWNDIEDLEKRGHKKHANDLLEVYRSIYIEYTMSEEQEKILQNFINKYGYDPT